MTFGRSDEAFWQMTPVQIDSLAETHRSLNDPKAPQQKSRPRKPSDLGPLLALSNLAQKGGPARG